MGSVGLRQAWIQLWVGFRSVALVGSPGNIGTFQAFVHVVSVESYRTAKADVDRQECVPHAPWKVLQITKQGAWVCHPVAGRGESGTVAQYTPGSLETGLCDLPRQGGASRPWDQAAFALRSPLNE